MRKIILSGAAAAVSALGAGEAYAFGPSPAAEQSPYAILEPQTVAPPVMSEGRAALVGDWRYGPVQGAAAAPFAAPTPQTNVSHGR